MLWGLPKAVYPMYTAVFVDVLGFTFLIPLLPELSRHFHVTDTVAAALISITALFATVSSPVWGYLSDRIGRKPVLIASQAFSSVGYATLAFAPDAYWLFAARSIEGLGGGNLGVAQSYIVDVVAPEQREKALSFGAAAFGIGFVVGPVLSGVLLHVDFRAPFWAAAILEIANIVLTSIWLEPVGPRDPGGDAATDRSNLWRTMKQPKMINVMSRQFLYIFSYTYFFTVFALYLQRVFRLDPAWSSLLLGLAGAIGAATQLLLVERVDRRFGAFRLAQGAFVIALVAYAALGFATTVGAFVAVLAIWAVGGSALRPALNTLIANDSPDGERGTILSIADSLSNLSMIAAPALGASVVAANARLAGIVPAGCIVVALALGELARRRGETSELRA